MAIIRVCQETSHFALGCHLDDLRHIAPSVEKVTDAWPVDVDQVRLTRRFGERGTRLVQLIEFKGNYCSPCSFDAIC